MPEDAEVWRALLRAKGLTVAQLAEDLHTTRQHAHRLLTGKRSAEARREELDRALALGPRRTEGQPFYAVATLSRDEELELLPAGDTQPLYRDPHLATGVAERFEQQDPGVCVVPVWPEYAWRRTVSFHAAWGSTAEVRNVFVVDDAASDVPLSTLIGELHGGYAETLRLRGAADDPERLREIEALVKEREPEAERKPDAEAWEPDPEEQRDAESREAEKDEREFDTAERQQDPLLDRIEAWVAPADSAGSGRGAQGAERLN